MVWEEDQISVLLNLWKEHSISRQIAEPTTRYKKVYKTMAEQITSITASPVCESKVKDQIKYMKRQYRLTSGEEMMNRWGYYDDMHDIMMREYSEEEAAEEEEEAANQDEEEDEEEDKNQDENPSDVNPTSTRKKGTAISKVKSNFKSNHFIQQKMIHDTKFNMIYGSRLGALEETLMNTEQACMSGDPLHNESRILRKPRSKMGSDSTHLCKSQERVVKRSSGDAW